MNHLFRFPELLFDPVIGKVVAIFIGVSIILLAAKILKGTVRKRIADTQNRYRIAKLITFGSYLVVVLLLTVVFSDKLGGLTTALGVAGAGVAFALQEVIASIAGWLAISAGGFFRTGDRVQLGGIKGDVIDISILRKSTFLKSCYSSCHRCGAARSRRRSPGRGCSAKSQVARRLD